MDWSLRRVIAGAANSYSFIHPLSFALAQMASVTIFLEAYDNAPDWDVLNRVLCQWRAAEERTRAQCDLPSVQDEYPGCFYYQRGHDDPVAQQFEFDGDLDGARHLQQQDNNEPSMLVYDIIMHNHKHGAGNATYKPRTIRMSEADHEPEDSNFDWDAFIQEQYQHDNVRKDNHRELLNYDHVGKWHNYFALLDVRTEYYYRYEGTQTVPPCYGRFFSNSNRGNTNHWRIMKDPMRVSQRQIDEMHRLLARRIAPVTDPIRPCLPDTAGKVDPVDSSKVNVARPLQYFSTHRKVFCECGDWRSKWPEDQAWCQKSKLGRFYDEPYNFETRGF
jgi:hypothetical protein